MAGKKHQQMPSDPEDRKFPGYPSTDKATEELAAEQAGKREPRTLADEFADVTASEDEDDAAGDMAPDEFEAPLPNGESREVEEG